MPVLLVLFASLLTLAGCGGGSGSGGGEANLTALFQGDYGAARTLGFDALEPSKSASQIVFSGDSAADGVGMVTEAATSNRDGSVNTLVSPFNAPYAVSGARVLEFLNARGTSFGRGGVSADGRIAIVAGTSSTFLNTYIQRSAVLGSPADLSGSFHFVAFARLGSIVTGYTGVAAFDGMGGVTWTRSFANAEGTVVAGTASTGTYDVTADGETTVTIPGSTIRGRMDASGDVMILAGGVVNGDSPFMAVLTPVRATASNADFTGNFFVVGLDWIGTGYRSTSGTLDATAADTVTLAVSRLSFVPATPADPPSPISEDVALGPYGFEVFSNGKLEVSIDGSTYEGALSPSGDVFFLGGPVSGVPAGPAILIGIRR
ncbi:MAG: hypothetical protein QNJ98_04545 [Planctomycetota bacterium]|nr:hypothetical protein [Planctomycetota bacterium]